VDIEKAIEFILNQQAQAEARAQAEKIRAAEAQARTEAAQARTEAALAKLAEAQAATQGELRRAIRLTVQEFRAERRRREGLRSEFDEKITQLAAAQLITEEKVKHMSEGLDELRTTVQQTSKTLEAFIESLRRGSNGHN